MGHQHSGSGFILERLRTDHLSLEKSTSHSGLRHVTQVFTTLMLILKYKSVVSVCDAATIDASSVVSHRLS